ncbi:hypothetical protein SBRY_30913 [Actinacidiphila bryophytorum]|uniref:Uncharacterized protein n=1 Tax=Actinacidiphila bryophytorum TaxID=1436133 RepID=A0A9W4H1X0_9ACTN|nr:hypothetical protein SBRY_30913 [Actinacidiphila bryophytorum]
MPRVLDPGRPARPEDERGEPYCDCDTCATAFHGPHRRSAPEASGPERAQLRLVHMPR